MPLLRSEEDIPWHGNHPAFPEMADALYGEHGVILFGFHGKDAHPALTQGFLLRGLHALFLLGPHVEQKAQFLKLAAQQAGGHLPVAQMRHEQERALPLAAGIKEFHPLGAEVDVPAALGQKTVRMDGGEVLVLAKGAVPGPEPGAVGIEQPVKTNAFLSERREEKIAQGDDPGAQA